MNVLLVYPLGSHDLQDGGDRAFPNVAAAVNGLPSLDPGMDSVRFRPGAQYKLDVQKSGRCIASLPIFGDTCRHLAATASTGPANPNRPISIAVQLIASKQTPSDAQDTAPLAEWLTSQCSGLWSQVLRTPIGRISLNIRPAWILTAPVDQEAVIEAYNGFYETYVTMAPEFGVRFFQTTCGTPQMSFAATIFGRDPALRFLYTPRNGQTRNVRHPLAHQRGATDRLVSTLTQATDWAAASEALKMPGNGYTPLGQARHPERVRIAIAESLALWGARRFANADTLLNATRRDCPELLRPAFDRFATVVRSLADPSVTRPSASHTQTQASPALLRAMLVDAFNRLWLASARHDTAAAILAADWFNQAWTLVMRTRTSVSTVPHAWEDELSRRLGGNRTTRKTGDNLEFFVLLLWKESVDPTGTDAATIDRYLPFHWVLQEVREARNDLMHGVVDFSPKLRRGEWTRNAARLKGSTALALPELLLGLACNAMTSLSLLPDDEAVVPQLAIGVGGAGTLPSRPTLAELGHAAEHVTALYEDTCRATASTLDEVRRWLERLESRLAADPSIESPPELATVARTLRTRLPHAAWLPHIPSHVRGAVGPASLRTAALAFLRDAERAAALPRSWLPPGSDRNRRVNALLAYAGPNPTKVIGTEPAPVESSGIC